MDESIQFKTYQETLRAQHVNSCNALLSRLVKHHGIPAPQPKPDIVEIVPIVVRHSPPPPSVPDWIKSIEDAPDSKGPSVKTIKACVAHHFNISPRDLESPRRFAKIVRPRQIAFYLARKLTTRSFPDIGRRFGGMDHTTILHACKIIELRMANDPELAKTVRCLEAQLA
jgi:hypothetical protein